MSTMTGIGPALRIDGPPPVPPEYTLLKIPGVRVDGEGRWENGINVWGYPAETPIAWEPCATGTYRDKEEGGDQPQERFDAVGLYVPITCSTFNVGDWRDFAGRATLVLDATLSFGVEQVLSQGVPLSGNPYLGDANVTVLGGGAVTPPVGLSWLENAIGETGRQGILHADPAVGSQWFDSLYSENEAWHTASGNPVAVGGGYIGATANGVSPGVGQSYAFASGPVRAYIGEVRLVGDDINGTLNTASNDVTFRSERFVLVEWDTQLQAAVLIDWTP